MSKADLISFFPSDRIFSCYDIRKWKPDPAIYLYAAKQMGFRPEDCIVIEDSPFGVQAAIEGGFDILIYADKDKEKKFNLKDKIFFDKMEMLNKILTH